MLNYKKPLEIIISLQILVISSMIPVFISIPFTNKIIQIFEIPITWQVPSIILMTLIFKGKIVVKAFTIYLLLGLFFIPVFHQGGSLGYLLTPNFGYLLGIYPLIKIIDNSVNNHREIFFYNFIKSGVLGIFSMHLVGIFYNFIQFIYYKQSEILLYNISNYSLGKVGYHLLMLTPITLLIKPINNRLIR